jgi:hypothetical protein
MLPEPKCWIRISTHNLKHMSDFLAKIYEIIPGKTKTLKSESS